MTDREYAQHQFTRPPGATELILVRHGASAPVRPGVAPPLLHGHSDPPLAPEGSAQARAVAERLAGEALAGVYVTPLRRTAETAAPLAERLGLQPVVVPELREVFLGEWESGVYRIKVANGDPLARRLLEEERWDLIPGAEPAAAFAARIRAGVERVVTDVGPDATAAVVVHGGVVGEIGRQATGSRPFAFIHADNGSITRLVVLDGGRWLLRNFNDTAHLEARPGDARRTAGGRVGAAPSGRVADA